MRGKSKRGIVIDNDEKLTAVLLREMSEVINDIAEILVVKLKEIIERVVYNPFNPKVYNRLKEYGGFLGSWEDTSKADIYGNTVTSTIESNPSKMAINRENFQHGSVLWDGEYYSDIRQYLDRMINEAGDLVGNLWGSKDPPAWWKSPRPYWDEFLALLENGEVNRLVEEEFHKRNILFERV